MRPVSGDHRVIKQYLQSQRKGSVLLSAALLCLLLLPDFAAVSRSQGESLTSGGGPVTAVIYADSGWDDADDALVASSLAPLPLLTACLLLLAIPVAIFLRRSRYFLARAPPVLPRVQSKAN